MVLEFTIVRLGWTFNLGLDHFVTQVIWAIGASMVVLAGLVWLPRAAIGAIGLVMIAGHNLLDGINAADFGSASWIWTFLHQPALLSCRKPRASMPSTRLFRGSASWRRAMRSGPVLARCECARQRLCSLGVLLTVAFVALAAQQSLWRPAPWIAHENMPATVLSMLNVEKYPPSLLYLMMTLGPGLCCSPSSSTHAAGSPLDHDLRRVPMLYYVAHIFLIHALAVVYAWMVFGDASFLFGGLPSDEARRLRAGLPWVYAAWLVVVVTLYPLCRWFADVKRRRSDWWISYL